MLHPTKNENGEIEQVSGGDAAMHFLSVGWKVLFSIVPPAHMMGGWACFVVSLMMIGLIVIIVGSTATLLGCVLGIKDGLTAVTFVAIGTSLPDTFASKSAAQKERYADAAIGNITGSNCVNVFLGLGLPWMISTLYYYSNDSTNKFAADGTICNTPGVYHVPKGSLGTAVQMYLLCSVIGFVILIVRRVVVGGELGGSNCGRFTTALFFFVLWLVYVVVVGLSTYGMLGEAAPVTGCPE